MGTTTLSQMESLVRKHLGNRTDLDDELDELINFAQDMICRQHPHSDLDELITDTLTADSATYTLSSVSRDIYSVRVLDGTNSRKLDYIEYRLFDDMLPKPDEYTTGRPSHYTFWETKLELWRVPDDTYSIRIRRSKWPTALSGSADTSDYSHMDDIIVCLATSWAFKMIGETDRMKFWGDHAWRQLRQEIINDMRISDASVVPSGNLRMVVSDYWKDPFVRSVF